MAARIQADWVVGNLAEVATLLGSGERLAHAALPGPPAAHPGPARGGALAELGIVEGGAVAVSGERIAWVGSEAELEAQVAEPYRRFDGRGGVLLPGFVDPHTHLLFAGSRANEFDLRIQGADYLAIAAAGGGILASVHATRAAADQALFDSATIRLDRMLQEGTTTVEVKTGYGLTVADELRFLEVLRRLRDHHRADVVPTFMGAHAIPPEFKGRAGAYTDLVVDTMLPAVAKQGVARFCDVFCEPGFFDVEQSRRILERAKRLGLGLKVHADEFEDSGGAVLAAELGAASADHLMAMGPAGAKRLAASDTIPTLLPGTSFFLGMERFADGRRLADQGLPLAVATDMNPGSSMVASMALVTSLACLGNRLRPAEALVAATRNAAAAVGLSDRGTLAPGALADLQLRDLPSAIDLPYQVGTQNLRAVWKRGRQVVGRLAS